MPRIYAIFAAQRLYLRRTADGAIEFTTDPAEADDIRIETPYEEAPLTLADAATKATPVVLLFPDSTASTSQSPLHPKDNLIAGGNTLAASRAASQIGRRWTVRPVPITEADGDGYYICLSIAADHTLAVSTDTTDAPGYRPILAGPDTVLAGRHPRVFYEEAAVAEADEDHDYCESCDKPVERGERWCCHGCRCDVEPGYERSFGR
jgi:hypothetical protein